MKKDDLKATQAYKLSQWANEGIDIPKLSKENHAKLLKQLCDRHLIPDNEKSLYGQNMLNPAEQAFFDYWVSDINPNFTALHGTEDWSLIEKAGGLIPVADRKRAQEFSSNTHTAGNVEQEVLYFVLGIGDQHETPQFLSNYSGQIKINFSDIPESQREVFNHTFIGGHRTEYQASRKYCDLKAGETVISVSYDRHSQKKLTTFSRNDGTVIQESLNFNDEIISHDNNINEIFSWLGLKLIQYLRFIGGDFQSQILQSRNVKEISAAFHSLFPSYRFPELKLMARKLPINAPYMSTTKYQADQYQSVHQLHNAVLCYEVEKARTLLTSIDVNTPNVSNQSPLFALLYTLESPGTTETLRIINQLTHVEKNIPKEFYEMLDLLLTHGAKLNSSEYFTPTALAIAQNNPRIFERIIAGSQHPDCPAIRHLPHITASAIQYIIYRSDVDAFTQVFPSYLKIEDPHLLLSIPYTALDTTYNIHNAVIILKLIAEKCDLSKPLINKNFTLLTKACMDGNTARIELLLNFLELDVNGSVSIKQGAMTYNGWSPLHFACYKGNVELAQLLIKHGANINQTTPRGASPLYIADSMGKRTNEKKFAGLVKILEQHGAQNTPSVVKKKYTHQNLAAAAMVTANCQENQYVLLVRKADQSLNPSGYYLFPGGLVDHEDANHQTCAVRETMEETGIDLSNVSGSEVMSFDDVIDKTRYQRSFFHFDLGECTTLPRINNRLGTPHEIGYLNWVEITQLNAPKCLPLQHANKLMLDMVTSEKKVDTDVISKSLHFSLSEPSRDIINELFNVAIEENNTVFINENSDLWRKDISNFPINHLQDKLNLIVDELIKNNMDSAKKHIIDVIEELVNSGRLLIDDFKLYIGNEPKPIIFGACSAGDEYYVERLIQIGAKMDHMEEITVNESIYRLTPLCLLIEFGHEKLARKMITQYNLNLELTQLIVAPLISACEALDANIEFINFLLSRMMNINMNVVGMALQVAIKRHRHDIIAFLLDLQQINLNREFLVKSKNSLTYKAPLQAAIASFDAQAVKILVEHGASTQLSISGHHNTVLALAMHYQEHCKKELDKKQGIVDIKLGIQDLIPSDTVDQWSSLTVRKLKEKLETLDDIIITLEDTVSSNIKVL